LHAAQAIVVAALLADAAAAVADEVHSTETMLHGNGTALSGAGITFAPEYGTGALAITWENPLREPPSFFRKLLKLASKGGEVNDDPQKPHCRNRRHGSHPAVVGGLCG
jgi:hypothetical protein